MSREIKILEVVMKSGKIKLSETSGVKLKRDNTLLIYQTVDSFKTLIGMIKPEEYTMFFIHRAENIEDVERSIVRRNKRE